MKVQQHGVRPSSWLNTDGRPSWSPDGTKVAVSIGRSSKVVSRDGTEILSRLGPEDKWVSAPQFSPDGEKIAYGVYTRPEGKEVSSWGVYVADADGSNEIGLTHYGRKPEWSPKGERISFMGYHDPRDRKVSVMDANGFNERPIGKEQLFKDWSWDPKGQRIAYEALTDNGPQIRVTDLSGTKDKVLTEGEGGIYWDRTPEWSPDGETIMFERHNRRFPIAELWQVDPDTGKDKLLFGGPGEAVDATWSPDGSRIAFVSDHEGDDFDLYVMDSDGGNLKQITDMPGHEHAPSWSPDGRSIALLNVDYDRAQDEKYQLHIVDVNGADTQGSSGVETRS